MWQIFLSKTYSIYVSSSYSLYDIGQDQVISGLLNVFSVGAGFIYWGFGWAFAYGDDESNPASRFIGVKGTDYHGFHDSLKK